MKITNKKLGIALILVFIFVILLSTVAYAKPFTDAFKGALIQINDFFAKEQFKTYAKTIDFFVFSLLFISIYMMGVRYAFKEVKRTERVIAVLLGLITAFLMVLGDFSIIALLPFVNWLLYFLLFILIWWMLKGMKSKFWRFILALLLTSAIILLVQGIFFALTPPEIRGPDTTFLKSFFASLGTIDVGKFQPGVPAWLSETSSYLKQLALKTAPTPPQKAEAEKAKEPKPSLPGLTKEELALGEIFDVDPVRDNIRRDIPGFPDVYKKFTLEKGKLGTKIGKRNYKLDENGNLLEDDKAVDPNRYEAIFKDKQRIQQEREKSAELLGLLSKTPKEGKTLSQREEEILKKGEISLGPNKYYSERDEEGKLILKKKETFLGVDWLKGDSIVDQEKDPAVKKFIEEEKKKQQQTIPAAPLAAPPSAPSPPTQPPATPTAPIAPPPSAPAKPTQPPGAPPPPAPSAPPPPPPKPQKGYDLGLIAGLVISAIVVLLLGIRKYRAGGRARSIGRGFFGEGGFIGDPIEHIVFRTRKFIRELDERIATIITTQDSKDKHVLLGENKEKLLEALAKADIANLWTKDGRKIIKDEYPILHELLELEERLRRQLNALRITEESFLAGLNSWKHLVPKNYFEYLKKLVGGIMHLIPLCDAFEKQDEASTKELAKLMQEGKIEELVHGKFKTVKADWEKLKKYNTHENTILAHIIERIKRQNDVLRALEKRISQPQTVERIQTGKAEVTAQPTGEVMQIPVAVRPTVAPKTEFTKARSLTEKEKKAA